MLKKIQSDSDFTIHILHDLHMFVKVVGSIIMSITLTLQLYLTKFSTILYKVNGIFINSFS